MNGLSNLVSSLGAARLILLGLVTAVMFGFFAFLANELTKADFQSLYSGMSPQDAGEIVSQLEAIGVEYQLSANGTQILVPSSQVLKLRVTLAQQGLPGGGVVGYEIFDRSEGLGTTSFVQNINLLRATEGELARTIGAFDQIRSARVHIVLPRRELFDRSERQSTASVFIRVRGSMVPNGGAIAAIQHLVAAAIPGLSPNKVSVIDGRGRLLANGDDDPDAVGAVAAKGEEYRRQIENHLKTTIESLLERTVGLGRVRAEVSADIDFDRITISEETFDPDGQVVRSTQTVEESSTSRSGGGAISVGNNLPENQQSNASNSPQENSARTEETVNFEISKTVQNRIEETGTIRRLSLAVLVDGIHTSNEETGETTYTPRTQDELDQLTTLVKSAIGFDSKRGDTVEVINLKFIEPASFEEEPEPLFGMTKADYFKIAEILILATVALLVILLVLRPLVTRVFAGVADGAAHAMHAGAALAGSTGQTAGSVPALASPTNQPQLEAPNGNGNSTEGKEASVDLSDVPAAPETLIDLDKVDGRVKESSVRKMSEIVDKHPEQALTILRGWMGESTH